MKCTTVSEICALKRPRHIDYWAPLELQERKAAEFGIVGGITRWRNVHGYRATGSSEPVED